MRDNFFEYKNILGVSKIKRKDFIQKLHHYIIDSRNILKLTCQLRVCLLNLTIIFFTAYFFIVC